MRSALAILVVMCSSAFGDEILLKDGKKIEWISIRCKDEASYEVETRQGAKITVKKSDVEKIYTSLSSPPAPLTGATFTQEKRKLVTMDLLPSVDLKKDVALGQWKLLKGSLIGSHDGKNNSKLQLKTPSNLEEYDLSLTIERKEGAGDFEIGLVGGGSGGKQFEIALDGSNGAVSGLVVSDTLTDPTATSQGAVLSIGIQRKVLVMVRKNGVGLRVDDKDLVFWAGDWSKLTVPVVHAVPSKDSLFFVCCNGVYEVSRAVITYPKN